ncbi:MAG: hypothetical protein ACRDDZ_01640 [Marinifilaceae bacterium]
MKRIKAYIKLIVILGGIYVFNVFGLKYITHSPLFMPVQKVVEEQRIDPSTFFYSDQLFLDTLNRDVTIRHLTKDK